MTKLNNAIIESLNAHKGAAGEELEHSSAANAEKIRANLS